MARDAHVFHQQSLDVDQLERAVPYIHRMDDRGTASRGQYDRLAFSSSSDAIRFVSGMVYDSSSFRDDLAYA